jgi:hypothetical protein
MKVLFTRSNNPLSRLICAITGEPLSHVALLPMPECVIHSTLTGVDFTTYARFEAAHSYIVDVEIDADYYDILPTIMDASKASYDYKALLFCGVMLLLRRWFPKWVPKQNLWQTTGMYMCTELVTDALGEIDSMITPYQLYLKLSKENKS